MTYNVFSGTLNPTHFTSLCNPLSKSIQILTINAPEMRYELCKCRENRGRDMPLWGVYIPNFGKISDGVNLARSGPLLHVKFHPHRCNVSPLRGKKTSKSASEYLIYQRFALCAKLRVKWSKTVQDKWLKGRNALKTKKTRFGTLSRTPAAISSIFVV